MGCWIGEERSDGGVIDEEVGGKYTSMSKVEYFGYWRVLAWESSVGL